MKPASFTLDRRLYELLLEEGHTQFTTHELRDAYAQRLAGMDFRLSDLRRYVYEQIRRMLRAGWLLPDAERRMRGQVYHLQPLPEHLQLELVDEGFKDSPLAAKGAESVPAAVATMSDDAPPAVASETQQRLEALLKEIRLDFLTSMGETERYKQLLEEMPHLRETVESGYIEARDRSSRLLGHLRAVERTLDTLPATR